MRKGLWSPEEDEKLYNYVTKFGIGCWSSVPRIAGLQRCGKSCRLRWINYLRPDLKRGLFSQEEEDLIISLHQALGNKWAQMATQLQGRTDNEIKNFWNSRLKKKLMKQGIDPNTHKPMITQTTVKDEKHCMGHLASMHQISLQEAEGNFWSKQVYDPLFLLDFQASILLDPSCSGTRFITPIDPSCGFMSMPNLWSLDQQNASDMDYSDILMNEARGSSSNNSSNVNSHSNNSAFVWDTEEFQVEFSGVQSSDSQDYRQYFVI